MELDKAYEIHCYVVLTLMYSWNYSVVLNVL